jgi:hypothetical protein
MNARTVVTAACGVAILGSAASAQDLSKYRGFELGSSLAAVSRTAPVAASDATTLHLRPALLQDLEWRPSRWSGDSLTTRSSDPVEHVIFSFYNDQLFRIVIDYGRQQTEGMTVADLTEAISEAYGTPAARPANVRAASRVEAMSGTPLARWEDGGHTVVLYRTSGYREMFRLVVTAVALEDPARKAQAEAERLDAREAPRRELERQKKENDDGLAAIEKTRAVNKKAFRP